MYHLTCKCGRPVIVAKRELEADEKSQIVYCSCWYRIEIQWPGGAEKRDANA